MSSFSRIGTIGTLSLTAAAGLIAVTLSRPVFAGDDVAYQLSDSASEAKQAEANAAWARVSEYKAQGGALYKTGTIERATQEARRLDQEAIQMRSTETGIPVETAAPPASPELESAMGYAKDLRDTGGPEYKSGAVNQADADVRALSPTPEVLIPAPLVLPANWNKPVEQIKAPSP
jgi:hypothetical protein